MSPAALSRLHEASRPSLEWAAANQVRSTAPSASPRITAFSIASALAAASTSPRCVCFGGEFVDGPHRHRGLRALNGSWAGRKRSSPVRPMATFRRSNSSSAGFGASEPTNVVWISENYHDCRQARAMTVRRSSRKSMENIGDDFAVAFDFVLAFRHHNPSRGHL